MTKKEKIILLIILILSFLFRVYNFKSFYVFSHDQDLASWIIKDIVVNGHLRLIGQETSSQGVFIGALFYYLQIPFYLLGSMNPLPAVFLSMILGVFATYSIFFVFSKITNIKVGLIGAFIYAISALIVFTDREVVPTMPVMLWTIWYLYSLYLIYKSEFLKGFVLFGFLVGLIWQLNLALLILTPLSLIAFLFSNKKINIKAILLGFSILLITSSPFIYFELRHNFSQSKAIYLSLTTKKDLRVENKSRLDKLDRVMQLVTKNSLGLFSRYNIINPKIFFWGLILLFAYLIKYKIINLFLAFLFFGWQIMYVLFFSLNALNPSEYYFNGMNVMWIFLVALGLFELTKYKNNIRILYLLALLFIVVNINFILRFNTDKKGYVEKMKLVEFIKSDSQKSGYPCASVSYITKPGYELGYRYLYWINNMHVNNPISNSPVYTIVFPLELVDRVDERFGSLGLIYPDYKRYNKKDVDQSCNGQNSNLTDPMFGYVE